MNAGNQEGSNSLQEQQSLPDPMSRSELESPKEQARQIVAQRGGFMNGGAFLTILFLAAFFAVSFSLGIYVERNDKLRAALAVAGVSDNGVVAQGQGQGGQVLGLEDGKKVDQKIAIDDSRAKGDKNAPVTIVEYSDFECPFCQKFYQETYQDIVAKYVNTGKVRIVFKDFPLAFHKNAQSAHEASRCAAEQGKFWEMHDKLFTNQSSLSVENYKKWAAEIGVDTVKFNQCVDSNKYAKAVKEDLNDAMDLGVQGTPSFIVNGTALVGAQPTSSFEKLIESELNR